MHVLLYLTLFTKTIVTISIGLVISDCFQYLSHCNRLCPILTSASLNSITPLASSFKPSYCNTSGTLSILGFYWRHLSLVAELRPRVDTDWCASIEISLLTGRRAHQNFKLIVAIIRLQISCNSDQTHRWHRHQDIKT
jgi:hypothetical protein